jgi:hypothetical protein
MIADGRISPFGNRNEGVEEAHHQHTETWIRGSESLLVIDRDGAMDLGFPFYLWTTKLIIRLRSLYSRRLESDWGGVEEDSR